MIFFKKIIKVNESLQQNSRERLIYLPFKFAKTIGNCFPKHTSTAQTECINKFASNFHSTFFSLEEHLQHPSSIFLQCMAEQHSSLANHPCCKQKSNIPKLSRSLLCSRETMQSSCHSGLITLGQTGYTDLPRDSQEVFQGLKVKLENISQQLNKITIQSAFSLSRLVGNTQLTLANLKMESPWMEEILGPFSYIRMEGERDRGKEEQRKEENKSLAECIHGSQKAR